MLRPVFLLVGLLLWPGKILAENWLWLSSPHFDMLSNAEEKSCRASLLELEQFRAAFLRFLGVQPEVPQRITVVLFATDTGFRPYKPLYKGKPGNVAGYFNGTKLSGFMALALDGDAAAGKGVIYHEYVHALYHEIDWAPPLWFNEGSAEVFSTFETKKGVAYLGRAPTWHVDLLRHVDLMPLPVLFSVNQKSPAYNEGLMQGVFYAQSWALAHFLICNRDPAWRNRLNGFLATVSSGATPDASAFASAMGMSLGALQAKLGDYIYGASYVIFKEPSDEAALTGKISSRPARAAERDCVLGVLQVLAQNSAAAAYHLIELAEKYPEAALPHEARAMRALQDDDPERADVELQRAVDRHTPNTRTYWLIAQGLVRTWLTTGIAPGKRIGEDEAGRLRDLLRRTLADCPDAVEAWEALARTEAFSPAPQAATLDELEHQAGRWPQDPRALQMLMLAGFARKRLGDEAAARRIAETVAASTYAAKSTQALNRKLLGEAPTAAQEAH
jgi:hypothetical protein